MNQLTWGQLKQIVNDKSDVPDDTPIFFRRVAPLCGNIEEAGAVVVDTYSSFGVVSTCIIIEPIKDDEDDD